MMMGVGFLFMLVIGLIVIGAPLLIVALVAGWLPGLLKSQSRQKGRQAPPPSSASISVRNCPACGRGVQADWNACPSCGAALT
ncbi:MAG TPA: zinc ribbon domain-containing protein [Anaerolineales bacterium]|nr:zinc ribbon domain-containing protein [Anaerolineales bacterium]